MLSDLPARIGRGSSSGADKVYVLNKTGDTYFTNDGELVTIEPEILRTPIFATNYGRFDFVPSESTVIIFPYKVNADGYVLIPENEFKKQYPNAYKYLVSRKKELEQRKQSRTWFGFSAPRNLEVHEKAQILVPLLANEGRYCRLEMDSSKFCLMASGGFSITIGKESKLSPNYVLGLLNSRLLFWKLKSISNVFRGGWITCTKQYVQTLPIHTIDFSNPAEVAQHDRLVALVETMLTLHKNLAATRLPDEKDRLQRRIAATDRAIDTLVYQLYDLSEEEIKIVESS